HQLRVQDVRTSLKKLMLNGVCPDAQTVGRQTLKRNTCRYVPPRSDRGDPGKSPERSGVWPTPLDLESDHSSCARGPIVAEYNGFFCESRDRLCRVDPPGGIPMAVLEVQPSDHVGMNDLPEFSPIRLTQFATLDPAVDRLNESWLGSTFCDRFRSRLL